MQTSCQKTDGPIKRPHPHLFARIRSSASLLPDSCLTKASVGIVVNCRGVLAWVCSKNHSGLCGWKDPVVIIYLTNWSAFCAVFWVFNIQRHFKDACLWHEAAPQGSDPRFRQPSTLPLTSCGRLWDVTVSSRHSLLNLSS